MTRIKTHGSIVPGCWPAQLAEAARLGERRRLRPSAEIDRFLAQLCYFSIRIDDETNARAWGDTLSLSRTHNIIIFDAAYLELALRLALPLASIDTTLRRAANAAGVPIFTP
jgi:predicted nucleic acid-binding protein